MEGKRKELLANIEENCKTMEAELKEWEKAINDKRHECYSLNHFTMKQILHLRKQLAKACTGQVAMDELPLQIFMLLESVDKNINPLVLANVLRTMIPDNSVFLTEDGFKDEQKYFASDTIGESNVAESVEQEADVSQPDTRGRKNSLETVTSAKETLEIMGSDEEYILAALQDCGRRATKDEIVAWVVSCEYKKEDVKKLCEEAKRNPRLSDLLEDVFGLDCQVANDEETFSDKATVLDR